jgi:predicted metalloprotease
MKWEGNRESDNVEDRRDGGGSGGGGRGGGVLGGRGIGIGTIVIALLGGWILGVNPLTILGLLSGEGGTPTAQVQRAPADSTAVNDPMKRFVGPVLLPR